jgi:hypothetical protein
MSNITVNLNINADTSGEINIFGEPQIEVVNKIAATIDLPASTLYTDDINSLFLYRDNGNSILCKANRNYNIETLSSNLYTIINNPFICTEAVPFSFPKYNNLYNRQQSFGNVAIAYYADKLFGHLAATAVIDNESYFIEYMNGTGSNTADINNLLANGLKNMSDSNAVIIARQVIGQDLSRTQGLDYVNFWRGLKFIKNDTIYLSVTLQPPATYYKAGQQTVVTSVSSNITYHLRINVGD